MNTTYIHGFSKSEQQRLSAMQDILNQRQIERMDFADVNRVLDVGSGLGQLTSLIRQQLPEDAVVVGIEKSEEQRHAAIELARDNHVTKTIEFRAGDALRLPLTENEFESFDLVHGRFILEHLRQPQLAIEQMTNAAKPGGQICLVDDDHELLCIYPECSELKHTWSAYWNSYHDLGHDPLVGRKIPSMLRNVGISNIRTDTIHYGATTGEQCFDLIVDNLIGVIVGSAEHLIENDRATSDQLDLMQSAVYTWRQNPNATIWYSLPIVVGIKN